MTAVEALVRAFGLCLGLDFGLNWLERDVGKALRDHFAQQRRTLSGGAVQPGFMRELKSDAIALDPANGAFDRAILAKVKIDSIPQHRRERSFDHRPAPRQVDKPNLMAFVLVRQPDQFIRQPMPISVTGVRTA